VLLGSEAKALGLVDDYGDVYDAGREALKLAKIVLKPEEVPNLIFVNQKKGFLQRAFEGSASLPSMLEAARVPPSVPPNRAVTTPRSDTSCEGNPKDL
jgi:ClpP class serine protease